MFIKLHRIHKNGKGYYLSEIVVNVSHVSFLTENREFREALLEGKLDMDINKAAEFTDVAINKAGNAHTITVVGSVSMIENKINSSAKQLLRG